MPRIKKSTVTFKSRREFENCVDEIAALQLKIDLETAEFNDRKARQDKEFKTRQKKLKERLSRKLSRAEMYASHHRDNLMGDKQSAETRLASFGYRKSPGVSGL